MFARYGIKVEAEQVAAMTQVAEYHKQKKAEAEAREQAANVVPIAK